MPTVANGRVQLVHTLLVQFLLTVLTISALKDDLSFSNATLTLRDVMCPHIGLNKKILTAPALELP